MGKRLSLYRMRKRFTRRRYFINRLDYRLEAKFQDRLYEPLKPKSRKLLFSGNPLREEEFPPEYPFGPDYEGDECQMCGCDCSAHEDDEDEY